MEEDYKLVDNSYTRQYKFHTGRHVAKNRIHKIFKRSRVFDAYRNPAGFEKA